MKTFACTAFLAVVASCAILAGPVTATAAPRLTYVAVVAPHEYADAGNGRWDVLRLLGGQAEE
jgi:hypothetical protein